MARGLLGIASAIALVTLLAKAVGFGRELVIAAVFGAGPAKDAYTLAYIVPSFALIMLGGLTGPFHTATQRVMTSLREARRDDEVPAVVGGIAAWVTLTLGVASVLAWLGAPMLIRGVASQARPEVFELAVAQLRIMAPLILIGGWVGILCGVSNDRGDYTRPSLSPLLASLAVIATVLLSSDPLALAWGTLLGGLGQLALQASAGIALWRGRPVGSPGLALGHPEVRAVWPMLVPACVSSTIGTLAVIIGTNFASALPPGSISVFDYANKLIQLPLGVLMTALLIPLFPMLTRAVVADDREALMKRLEQGLSTISLATFPLVALFVAAGPALVAVVYERGAFSAGDTQATALVLALCAWGIPAYAGRDLMIRVFYAMNDGRTPLAVSVAALGLTTAGMALVVGPYGLSGLALVTSAVTVFNFGVVLVLLRRRLGAWPGTAAVADASRAVLAAGAAGWVAWRVGVWSPGGWGALGTLGLQGVALAFTYGLSLLALGLRPRQIAERLRGPRAAGREAGPPDIPSREGV